MNTVQLLDTIKNIALSQNTCNSAFDGDVYDNWNSGEVKFGSVNAAINEIASEDQLFTYSVYLYYGDRLLQDKSNVNQIVTDGVNTIQSIINILNNEDGIDVTGTIAFTPFEQKFADYLAGVYCQIYVTTDSPLGSCEMDSYTYTDSKDEIIAELTQELTEARDELRIVKAELADAEADLAAARREIEELEADVNAKEAEITRLEGVIGELETEVSSLTAQVTTLTHQIEVDEAEISRLEGIISDKNETIATLQSQVTSLTQQIQTKNERIAELEASIATLTTKSIDGNGEYTPPSGTLGWNKVIVAVPSDAKPEYKLTTSITANDTYTYLPTSGQVFNEVKIDVNVPSKTEEHLTTSLTQNDTYNFTPTADSVFSGATITVAVPIPTITLEDIEVTSNGVYEHGQGYDGLGKVKVDVPDPPLQIKGVTVNGTVTADTGYYGLSEVRVQVPSDRKPEQQLTQTISSNTTTSFTPDTGYVFSGVTITTNVQPPLENVTATTNGVVTASTGYYGLGEVNVQVPSKPERWLNYERTQNGEVTILPPDGEVICGVTLTTNVQPALQNVTATTNHSIVTADSNYYGLGSVTVEIPSDRKPEDNLTATLTTNNLTTSFTPQVGHVFSGATITVEVEDYYDEFTAATAQLTAVTDEYEDFTADTAQNVTACYTSCNTKGATMPAQRTLANLPSTILTIPTGGGGSGLVDISPFTGLYLQSRDDSSLATTLDFSNWGHTNLRSFVIETGQYITGVTNITSLNTQYISNFRLGVNCDSIDMSGMSFPSANSTTFLNMFQCNSNNGNACYIREIRADNMTLPRTSLDYMCGGGGRYSKFKVGSFTGTTMDNVIGLRDAFFNCPHIEQLYLGNTSSVTSFYETFYGSRINTIKSTIEGIDTSSATSLYRMLSDSGFTYDGGDDTDYYELDLTGWDTSHVTDFRYLFTDRFKLTKLNLDGWSAASVTSNTAFYSMFSKNNETGMQRTSSIVGNHTAAEARSGAVSVFNGLKVNADFTTGATYWDAASSVAIINGLADLTGQTGKTLTLGSTAIGNLFTTDIAKATNKNWTLA